MQFLLLRAGAQYQRHHHRGNHQRRTAIADKRQSQPLGGQDTHIDSQIDERLGAEHKGDAVNHIGVVEKTPLLQVVADTEHAPAEQAEAENQQQGTEQPPLLRQHRENEIGVRFRQVKQFLHAVTQTHAKPMAATKGDQALRQLIAGPVLIRPGIEKTHQPRHPVGLRHGHQGRQAHRHQPDQQESQGRHTGQEQHAHGGDTEHHHGAEIRFQQQHESQQPEHPQRHEKAFHWVSSSALRWAT